MCGCNVFVASMAAARLVATSPAMYASIVSNRDIGLLSVSEFGFGIGILSVCLALFGMILCIRASSMVCSMSVVHSGGSLPRRFSVKPPFRALVGVVFIMFVRSICVLGLLCFSSYVYGQLSSLFGLGGVNMCAS